MDGKNVSYFKVGVPPRSKNKFKADNQRIDSNGDFGLRAGKRKKKKSKISGTFNSNAYDENSKMMQSRSKNALYHTSWTDGNDIATDTTTAKNKRKCSFCGQTGHTRKDCVKFFNCDGYVMKDEEREPGHYAIYECTQKVAEELCSFKKDLLIPPQDFFGKNVQTVDCKGDVCDTEIDDRVETIYDQQEWKKKKQYVKKKGGGVSTISKKKKN